MRRKSERTASKKSKPSPEKKEKVEKVKHSRSRRRKQSTSSESAEDPPPTVEASKIAETKVPEPKSAKDDNTESEDQVWQVKSTESSGDVGEIHKLKLCLARPPSTPERVDRSPRSKRKHLRATSSSDNQSVEEEEKKKSRHRSKRHSESKPDAGKKTHESKVDTAEVDTKDAPQSKPMEMETDQSDNQNQIPPETSTTDETPVSTTTEDIKSDTVEAPNESETAEEKQEEEQTKTEESKDSEVPDKTTDEEVVTTSPKSDDNKEQKENTVIFESGDKPFRKRSLSAEKSEILELHAEESRLETSEVSFGETQDAKSKDLDEDKDVSNYVPSEVSSNICTTEISGQPGLNSEDKITSENSEDVTSNNSEDKIDSNTSDEKVTTNNGDDTTTDITEDKKSPELNDVEHEHEKNIVKETTPTPDSTQSEPVKDVNTGTVSQNNNKENSETSTDIPNGEVPPLVVNRKRRWGSRANKFTTQKSITISTDVLKEIIPDVKPVEFEEVIEEKKHKRIGVPDKIDRPILPKIVIDNTENIEVSKKDKKIEEQDHENVKTKDTNMALTRKISIVKDQGSIIARPPSPPRHKQSNILYITNLVRPFTLPQLKNLLQRTGRIVENGFWIDRIKSKCYVQYENEDQAVETRHALHGVTWPVSNPKTLHVDFSTIEDFDKAKANEETDNAKVSTIPGTVEDWLREQDIKREKGELEKPWERKMAMREWDVGKNEKTKDQPGRPDKNHREERPPEKRRHRTIERSPEPARKFKKKEEEAPAKLLDDLFKKTKATPCIYWLPLSAETIAVKEEQRRQHMAEHERRLQELRRTHRRH